MTRIVKLYDRARLRQGRGGRAEGGVQIGQGCGREAGAGPRGGSRWVEQTLQRTKMGSRFYWLVFCSVVYWVRV